MPRCRSSDADVDAGCIRPAPGAPAARDSPGRGAGVAASVHAAAPGGPCGLTPGTFDRGATRPAPLSPTPSPLGEPGPLGDPGRSGVDAATPGGATPDGADAAAPGRVVGPSADGTAGTTPERVVPGGTAGTTPRRVAVPGGTAGTTPSAWRCRVAPPGRHRSAWRSRRAPPGRHRDQWLSPAVPVGQRPTAPRARDRGRRRRPDRRCPGRRSGSLRGLRIRAGPVHQAASRRLYPAQDRPGVAGIGRDPAGWRDGRWHHRTPLRRGHRGQGPPPCHRRHAGLDGGHRSGGTRTGSTRQYGLDVRGRWPRHLTEVRDRLLVPAVEAADDRPCRLLAVRLGQRRPGQRGDLALGPAQQTLVRRELV